MKNNLQNLLQDSSILYNKRI